MTIKDPGEMPAEYQKYLAEFLRLSADRERFAEELKDAPPGVQQQGYPVLRQLEQAIARIESELAQEYERIVAERRRAAEIGRLLDDGDEAVEELFIQLRDHKPDLLEDFKAVVFRELSEEEEQEFYDRIAIRENKIQKGKS